MFWRHLVRQYEYTVQESYVYHPDGYWRIKVSSKKIMADSGVCLILIRDCRLFKWIEHC